MSARYAKFVLLFCCAVLTLPMTASAQVGGNNGGGNGGNGGGNNGGNNNGNNGNNQFFSTGVVGGVKIDTSGVLKNASDVLDPEVRDRISKGLQNTDANIKKATKLRMISLRGLEAAINKAHETGDALPSEVNYMAGLQRIEYVVLSKDKNDIIIAGPAEGYKLNEQGVVVGETSGTPVIHLEDFLVAMRSVENARRGQGVSVSIDPTEQGVKQLQKFFNQLRQSNMSFQPAMQAKVEQAMGPQPIRLTGVPSDSRFSQVLVAADYKMKRLGMGLEQAAVSNFPSVLEMAQKAKVSNMKAMPRFWMECSYEPVAKSEDGAVWQIRGKGVKTLTEEEKFNDDGKKVGKKVKQNRFAKKWAETMTERFEELAASEPAFQELRNIIDLSVIAAIIKSENLNKKAGLEMPAILGKTNAAMTPSYAVPKVVPAQCSFAKIQ
ncbi:MAG: DUF1598 domain-containing protein, partial [Mariniblastus sp.]|nr:DUF1598 domain-containing protein [Mariniblastus sp.]